MTKSRMAAPEGGLPHSKYLGIGAHPDDLEFGAFYPIWKAHCSEGRDVFTGVIVTDGAGSPRGGAFADCSDDEMIEIRWREQREAAAYGKYGAIVGLGYPSPDLKGMINDYVVQDLARIIDATRPEEIYVHNLFDKHRTHIAVTAHTIKAIQSLSPDVRPKKLIGYEVWRNLDWVPDTLKMPMDVSGSEDFAKSIISVFGSQIDGNKNYVEAVLGRRRGNATFFDPNHSDQCTSLIFGVDMSVFCTDPRMTPERFVAKYIDAFRDEALEAVLF